MNIEKLKEITNDDIVVGNKVIISWAGFRKRYSIETIEKVTPKGKFRTSHNGYFNHDGLGVQDDRWYGRSKVFKYDKEFEKELMTKIFINMIIDKLREIDHITEEQAIKINELLQLGVQLGGKE